MNEYECLFLFWRWKIFPGLKRLRENQFLTPFLSNVLHTHFPTNVGNTIRNIINNKKLIPKFFLKISFLSDENITSNYKENNQLRNNLGENGDGEQKKIEGCLTDSDEREKGISEQIHRQSLKCYQSQKIKSII